MVTVWELNPIVLCHRNRFLQAATLAVLGLEEGSERLVRALGALSGNMLWASSSFKADSRETEREMAYAGALVSAVSALAPAGDSEPTDARQALACIERELREGHDAILAFLARELSGTAIEHSTPAQLDAAVWKRLFPEFPYESSLFELAGAIREWLLQAGRA